MQIAVKYIDTGKYNIELFYDDVSHDDPREWGNYELVLFERRDDFEQYLTENGKLLPSLQAKLKRVQRFLSTSTNMATCAIR